MEPDTHDSAERLAALLAWYREMGITSALDAAPIDWRARGDHAPGAGFVMPSAAPQGAPALARGPRGSGVQHQPTPAQPLLSKPVAPVLAPARLVPPQRSFERSPAPNPPSSAPLAPPADPVAATSLAELGAALAAFEGCGLKATAKSLCLYRGAQTARLMIIGEAPGREEDLAGKPFVGPAGQLLDRMLAAIGYTEANVHIANVVYWRPPGNRTPTPQEALACAPFLTRQIELVAPDVILLVGGAAAKHLLSTEDGIMKLRGKWREIESAGRPIKTMATLHPAYVLRAPASKRQVWRDLLALKAAL